MLSSKPAQKRVNPRPQRLHSWFTLIPVQQFERQRPARVPFLDAFTKIERVADGYRVLFEGKAEMSVIIRHGLIFVWYGENLQKPDRPFPTLFARPYSSQYISSAPTLFHDTHVMDFVENGSDNLHFKSVHLWQYSKIYDHQVTPETISLKQDTRFKYGSCSTKRSIRLISKLLPELELTQDYVYHGPGLAVVGATGKGTPRMHALVSLTPEGPNRTRVYVTMAIDPTTFPRWAERIAARIPPRKPLCDVLAGVMANFIKNEFDIDAIIWANKKYLPTPRLLASERHLHEVIRWGETFYPKDWQRPAPAQPRQPARWRDLDTVEAIPVGTLKRYTVGDQEVVATRLDDGKVSVFDAFCPHQGAHLGHGGRLENGCLRCPFHGFYFDPNGQCLGPNRKNTKPLAELRLGRIEHRGRGRRIEILI